MQEEKKYSPGYTVVYRGKDTLFIVRKNFALAPKTACHKFIFSSDLASNITWLKFKKETVNHKPNFLSIKNYRSIPKFKIIIIFLIISNFNLAKMAAGSITNKLGAYRVINCGTISLLKNLLIWFSFWGKSEKLKW